MTEDSQIEGAEEDFQRWMKEVREFEAGQRDETPTIFGDNMPLEEKESKLTAMAKWLMSKI